LEKAFSGLQQRQTGTSMNVKVTVCVIPSGSFYISICQHGCMKLIFGVAYG